MMHINYRSLGSNVIPNMRISFFLALGLTISAANAQSTQESSLGESVERHLSKDEAITQSMPWWARRVVAEHEGF